MKIKVRIKPKIIFSEYIYGFKNFECELDLLGFKIKYNDLINSWSKKEIAKVYRNGGCYIYLRNPEKEYYIIVFFIRGFDYEKIL